MTTDGLKPGTTMYRIARLEEQVADLEARLTPPPPDGPEGPSPQEEPDAP